MKLEAEGGENFSHNDELIKMTKNDAKTVSREKKANQPAMAKT